MFGSFSNVFDKAHDAAEDAVEDAQDAAEDAVDEAQDAAEAAAAQAKKAAAEALQVVERAYERAKQEALEAKAEALAAARAKAHEGVQAAVVEAQKPVEQAKAALDGVMELLLAQATELEAGLGAVAEAIASASGLVSAQAEGLLATLTAKLDAPGAPLLSSRDCNTFGHAHYMHTRRAPAGLRSLAGRRNSDGGHVHAHPKHVHARPAEHVHAHPESRQVCILARRCCRPSRIWPVWSTPRSSRPSCRGCARRRAPSPRSCARTLPYTPYVPLGARRRLAAARGGGVARRRRPGAAQHAGRSAGRHAPTRRAGESRERE